MRDPDWYPKDTYFNIYGKDDFSRQEDGKVLREHNSNWSLFLYYLKYFYKLMSEVKPEFQCIIIGSYQQAQYQYEHYVFPTIAGRPVLCKELFKFTAPFFEANSGNFGLFVCFVD